MKNLIERLEYSVITKASREEVWRAFSDYRNWPTFSDIYGNMLWVQGQPWQPGSRLRIEVVKPLQTTIDHVIISCTPREQVAWIDHALGTTMEQWVVFEPLADGGTRVRTWAEFTGTMDEITGRPLREWLREFIADWYGNFGEFCDQLELAAVGA